MTKRNLFAEITEGFEALKEQRQGKRTLRTTGLQNLPDVTVSAEEVRAVRESLHLSQPVFAHCLRTKTQTLRNWEQGRAKPNAQASLLIKMLVQFPDTVQRLEAV
jgi:putative transcriptional regulator